MLLAPAPAAAAAPIPTVAFDERLGQYVLLSPQQSHYIAQQLYGAAPPPPPPPPAARSSVYDPYAREPAAPVYTDAYGRPLMMPQDYDASRRERSGTHRYAPY